MQHLPLQMAQSVPDHIPHTLQVALSWMVAVAIFLGITPVLWNRILVPLWAFAAHLKALMSLSDQVEKLKSSHSTNERALLVLENKTQLGHKWFKSRWEALFAAHSTAMFVCNTTGENLAVNEAYCRLLDTSKSELLGLAWRQFLTPEDLRNYSLRSDDASKYGIAFKARMTMTTSKNRRILVAVSVQPIMSDDGEDQVFFGSITRTRGVRED